MDLIPFLLIPFVLFFIIGLRERHNINNLSEFFLYGGQLEPRGFWATLASTNLSVSNFLVVCGIWGFAYGWSSIVWIGLAWAIALVFFFEVVIKNVKVKSYIEDTTNMGTLHEFLGIYYGSAKGGHARYVRMTASAVSIISFWVALTLEIVIGVDFFNLITSNGSLIQLFVVLLVITLAVYTSLAGFRSVVKTDLYQLIFIFIGMFFAALTLSKIDFLSNYTTIFPKNISGNLFGQGWLLIVPMLVFGLAWFTVGMDSWQRCAATRNANISIGYTIVMVLILLSVTAVCVFMGIYDRIEAIGDGYNPLLEVMARWKSTGGYLQYWTVALLFTCLISAMISTSDTQLVILSQSFVADILLLREGVLSMEDLSLEQQKVYLRFSRVMIAILSIGIVPAFVLIKALGLSLESVFFIAYAVQIPLFPIIIGAMLWKQGPKPFAAIYALIAGVVCTLLTSIPASLALSAGENIDKNTVLLYMSPVVGLVVSGIVIICAGIYFKKN
jgi:solute:Na+ symporter, SSS family